jgi:hypothetical protein
MTMAELATIAPVNEKENADSPTTMKRKRETPFKDIKNTVHTPECSKMKETPSKRNSRALFHSHSSKEEKDDKKSSTEGGEKKRRDSFSSAKEVAKDIAKFFGNLRGSLRRRFSRSDVTTSDDVKVFGCDLYTILAIQRKMGNTEPVPFVISKCIEQLKSCAQLEGIFRESGDNSHLTKLVEQIDAGVDIEWDKVANKHTLACLLKQYVRELPHPLIPDVEKYLEVAEIQNDAVKKEKILSLLQNIDIVNFVTLRKLFGLLHEFADEKNSSLSKMNANNLALVWTPNLFRVDGSQTSSGTTLHCKQRKDTKPLTANDVLRITSLNHRLQEIVILLIQNFDFFFQERKNEKEQLEWFLKVNDSQSYRHDDILDESEEDNSLVGPPPKKQRVSHSRHKLSLSGRFRSTRSQRQSLDLSIFEPPSSPREPLSSATPETHSNLSTSRGNLLPIPSSPRHHHRLSIKRNLSGSKLKYAAPIVFFYYDPSRPEMHAFNEWMKHVGVVPAEVRIDRLDSPKDRIYRDEAIWLCRRLCDHLVFIPDTTVNDKDCPQTKYINVEFVCLSL